MKTNKKTPNPNGRKGCEAHQSLIKKMVAFIVSLGLFPVEERMIITKDGKKRFADVVGLDDSGELIEIVQVGITNKNGEPVSRERQAIEEIEKATGKKVRFVAYKTLIILILIAAGWYAVT